MKYFDTCSYDVETIKICDSCQPRCVVSALFVFWNWQDFMNSRDRRKRIRGQETEKHRKSPSFTSHYLDQPYMVKCANNKWPKLTIKMLMESRKAREWTRPSLRGRRGPLGATFPPAGRVKKLSRQKSEISLDLRDRSREESGGTAPVRTGSAWLSVGPPWSARGLHDSR